jgi:hypothetical protein
VSARVIAERVVGSRKVVGTEWPIVDSVERRQYGARVEWVVTRGLCNGIPTSASSFRTRREALETYEGMSS